MAEKLIKGRSVQKHDTEANWLKATNFIPKKGEIIIYDKDSTYDYERMKIGDGSTVVSLLPFIDDNLKVIMKEQIDEAVESIESGKVSNADHATSADKATTADKAITADKATEATHAESADEADHATTADSSNTANHATTADSADFAATSGDADTLDGKHASDFALADIVSSNYDESIIGLSIEGQTITYIKGDGSVHTMVTQDTNTEYFLATDETTGLTKLYATVGNAEDGTMTQKAIKTELDKKVGVRIDDSQNTLVFTI